jgi:tRNA-specific 2-thiouridylase
MFLDVDASGVIRECSARIRGRDVAFATASALCEAARGQTVVEAARLGVRSGLHSDFRNMDAASLERALVVEDAFHHALGTWLRSAAARGVRLDLGLQQLVGMSGGVDSAVALHTSMERCGGAVAGITLRMWIDPRAPDPDAACCSPDSVRRARATCHAAGVAHISIDVRREFAQAIVTPFVQEYAQGRTPNPCVACNGRFRLQELVDIADVVGAEKIVTGHYVQRRELPDGRVLVARGADRRKDQSYMLARLAPDLTARFQFPLGGITKPQVRQRAEELGLEQATIADSQEVCFLGGGDYRTFLARSGALGSAGTIELEASGEIVGHHDGIARFTPGQRRGLGDRVNQQLVHRAGVNEPLYVTDVDGASGTVTIGTRSSLRRNVVELADAVSWIEPLPPVAVVQLRYSTRSAPESACIEWGANGHAMVRFTEPVIAPAAGQVACFYDESGTVIGAGTIVSSSLEH